MVVAIVPAYNEERTIAQVLRDIRSHVDRIIVIDDGSTDATRSVALQEGAEVISHALNRDLGSALQTGFCAALESGADWVITFDADGQMVANDIPGLLAKAQEGTYDAVLGNRFALPQPSMPMARRWSIRTANMLTWLLTGAWSNDTQAGLRCLRRHALETMTLTAQGMEVSSEIISSLKRHNLRWAESPMHVHYTSYSLSKPRSQNIFRGIETVWKLVVRQFE